MKSKEKIVNSLVKLMQEMEYESITIKEICEDANVYRSTYYRNFKSKEYVIKYKLAMIMDEYLEDYQKQEDKTKKGYLYCIFSTFKKYEDFFKIIHQQKQSYLLQDVLQEYFKSSINDESIKDKYTKYYHMGGIYNFTICWIENDFKQTPDELTQIAYEITKEIPPILMK